MNKQELETLRQKIRQNIECSFDVGGVKHGYDFATESILELFQEQLDEPSEVRGECENIAKIANSFHCSKCNYAFDGWGVSSFKLCPNCGAKIRRE